MNEQLYLYAITESQLPFAINQRGVESAAVFFVECGRLAAAVSHYLGGLTVEVNTESALRHEAVVEELYGQHATLPVRFGTLTRDESQLRELLSSREDACLRALDKVRGHVELGLLVLSGEGSTPSEPEPSLPQPSTSGRGYLMGKLEEERKVEARRLQARLQAETLCGSLLRLARESTLHIAPTPGLLFSAAFLVDRADVDGFVGEVSRLQRECGPLRFLCTGPWPAYSFVGDELGGPLPASRMRGR